MAARAVRGPRRRARTALAPNRGGPWAQSLRNREEDRSIPSTSHHPGAEAARPEGRAIARGEFADEPPGASPRRDAAPGDAPRDDPRGAPHGAPRGDAPAAGTDAGPGRPGDDWARPISRANLSEAAYRAMRDALTEGRLRPGAALPLRPMSRRLGISVTPMREAMLRLASERALTIDARGAASVPVLQGGQVEEIRALREDLEGRAAAQAALGASAAGVDGLARINDHLIARHAARDFAEAVRANTRFHLALARLGGSPILADLVEGLWVRSGPLLWHSGERRAPRWTPGPHFDLLAALRAHDPDAARAAMQADAARWAQGYRRFAEGGEDAAAPEGAATPPG